MSLQVELKPYVVKDRHTVGGAVVEFDVHFSQCYVMVNGKQVGWYCGKKNEDGTYEQGKFLSFIEY